MRCRPHDICVVSRTAGAPLVDQLLGLHIVVTECYLNKVGKMVWRYEAPKRYVCWRDRKLTVVAFHDDILTPIRPGAGEDEMLRIAGRPAPSQTERVRNMVRLRNDLVGFKCLLSVEVVPK